ncbi:MAG: AAA family ATPase, partial [Candidatus Micrarchaeota archaeon]
MEKDKIIELTKKGFELIETHISWVLLSDEFAYKIKKPVKFSFLDFSTIEKRKTLCDEEVRLNKRLSPDIYIEVVSVNDLDGILEFNGNGDVIDYAVKMKKLNQENRMDMLLKDDKIGQEHVKEIAGIVADFHKNIDVIRETGYGSAKTVKKQIDDLGNFRGVIENACGLGKTVDFILEKSDEFIGKHRREFEKRHDSGKVRDCHGDLHSANIFIGEKITIFDCIEFSKDFRFIDTASEIAFMAMDLDAFG